MPYQAILRKTMETKAEIRYQGPALEMGRMDVFRASENMIAFSELMTAAVKVTYGDYAEVKTEVAGFKEGSFLTGIVITVAGQAMTIFAALSQEQLWDVVKGAFELWKILKGDPPKSIENNGNFCNVTNNSGQIIQIRTESLNLVFNEKAADAVTRFVANGLEPKGFENLQISYGEDQAKVLSVNKHDSKSFKRITREQIISDNTNKMIVQIVTAVFQDGNKWRFSDGERPFSAIIEDQHFLDRVNSGERFGKGDLLEVDMNVIQKNDGIKTTIERSIVLVHRHITPSEQGSFL